LSGRDLYYAKWNGVSWEFTKLDTNQYYFFQTSLALDGGNRAYISYYDWGLNQLMLAFQIYTGSWDFKLLDTDYDVGIFNSLALSPEGFAYIAYYDATWGHVKLTWDEYGYWSTTVVDDGGGADVGRYVSLKMDPNSHSHMSHYNATNGDLRYTYLNNNHQWATEIIDSAGDVGLYTSLVLDGNNYPHIAYYDKTIHQLKYAYYDGTWHYVVLDDGSSGKAGVGLSLAAIPNGYAVAYVLQSLSDPSQASLVYRYCINIPIMKTCLWQLPQTVDTDVAATPLYYGLPDDVYGVSLAIDQSGVPYIAYKNYLADTLSVAHKDQGAWEIDKPDISTFFNGLRASLAIDSYGRPHVSYIDEFYYDMRYALLNVKVFMPVVLK
jgi:hypothetical protein